MNSIINFYKELDMINLIIFWGIVIVVILIIILIIIMICKHRKLKKSSNKINSDIQYEEELPIKKEEPKYYTEYKKEESLLGKNYNETNEIFIDDKNDSQILKQEIIEEQKDEQEPENKPLVKNKQIELPTGPYQRNVLREMALSQTSPIGINRKDKIEEKEMIQDLSNSLKHEQIEEKITVSSSKSTNEYHYNSNAYDNINKQILNNSKNLPKEKIALEESKANNQINLEDRTSLPQELLDLDTKIRTEKSSSEQYLEEVSQKLSESEVIDEVERTNYELQQEEDAIISYKELMEKKDSIQTIDEEDAIISIEELMNRETTKQLEDNNDSRLYNLEETEKNDDFIEELKQFRKDL